jgi:CRP-like cAMP-binding protein
MFDCQPIPRTHDAASPNRTSRDGKTLSNHILLGLQDDDFQILKTFLIHHPLRRAMSLQETGQPFDFVYFIDDGLVSILACTQGRSVEVGLVGREGLIGLPALIGTHRSPYDVIVENEGNAYRVHVEKFRELLASKPSLRSCLFHYAVMQGTEAFQTAACNRLHTVEQRLARRLLAMQKRLDHEALQVTHDHLANLLGTDRPSVSLAARRLRLGGAIEYKHGKVRILDTERLLSIACDCARNSEQLRIAETPMSRAS